MANSISVGKLLSTLGTARWPSVVCCTRRQKFEAEQRLICGSVWRDHMQTESWGPMLAAHGKQIVVYCMHGHNVSQLAASRLRAQGLDAVFLEGGIDAWEQAGNPTLTRQAPGVVFGLPRPSEWVTRRRPKIDRIACPWLIRRFVDPDAIFHFVDAEWVVDVADELGGNAFDVEDVLYSHRGETCTFDTMLEEFGIDDGALRDLAAIVRGADTGRFDLAPQAAGLLAISLGLSVDEEDDLMQLEKGMFIYDALYSWRSRAGGETHNWPAVRRVA